jgi:hypothetical protein
MFIAYNYFNSYCNVIFKVLIKLADRGFGGCMDTPHTENNIVT